MDCSFLQSSRGCRVCLDLQDLLVHQVEIRHHPGHQAGEEEEDRQWETQENLMVTPVDHLQVRLRDLRHRVRHRDPYRDRRRGHPRESQLHRSCSLPAERSIQRQEGHLLSKSAAPRHPILGLKLQVLFLRQKHRGQN